MLVDIVIYYQTFIDYYTFYWKSAQDFRKLFASVEIHISLLLLQ